MNNSFDETLHSLVSALKYSQYKHYVEKWRGREEFRSEYAASDTTEREAFVADYVAHHLDEGISRAKEEFPEKFHSMYKRWIDESGFFRKDYAFDIARNLSKYAGIANSENWFGEQLDTTSPTEKEKIREMISAYIMENDKYEITELYKQLFKDREATAIRDVRLRLIGQAEDAYDDYLEENGIDESIKHINVSEVYKHLFDSLIGENPLNTTYRCYFDIDITARDLIGSTEKNIHNGGGLPTSWLVSTISHAVFDALCVYFEILHKDKELEALKNKNDREFEENLLHGYYFDPVSNRKFSIGKIFNNLKKINKDNERMQKSLPNIEKLFFDRPTPFSGKVVICRHPYDIAGMSTDRGWTSCMDLNTHMSNTKYIEPTIMRCGLCAYLIKNDDPKIHNPVARVLLKTYTLNGEKVDYENPNWILKTSDVYGTIYSSFVKAVQNWADKNWNDSKEKGQYERWPEFYQESKDRDSYDTSKKKYFDDEAE